MGSPQGDTKYIEIWNAELEAWRRHLIDLPIFVHRARTLLLMRYPANGLGRAVGQRISMVQRQSFSKWLLARLDEYVDGDANEVGG